jgi:sugar lactone lactonase YvrE
MALGHFLRLMLFVGVFCGGMFLRTPAAQVATTTVMSGLDNPRGLAIDPDGVLYVAEAGKGGTGPCRSARGQSVCFGASGAVSRLREGRQERVITRLPSAITPTGEVTGPHDVAATRSAVYVMVGLGGDPAEVQSAYGSDAKYFGKLLVFLKNGLTIPVDVSGYEATRTGARRPIDSNPYGLLLDGREGLIADAGANAVFRIGSGGLTTYAVLPAAPQRPFDAVPTAIVRGPDGAHYIGELTGVPFLQGAARIYRVTADGVPQVFLEGFKTIIDLAFGPDGSLYVLEHASGPQFFAGPGQIVRVASNGVRSAVLQGLDRPTSIAVDRDGRVFVTNHGISAGTGEVLRIN